MRPQREVVVFFAREPREVEDDNKVNPALVCPAVLEEPLQLRSVGSLRALAFFPELLENFVALSTTVFLARAKLRGQTQVLGLLLRASTPGRSIGPPREMMPVRKS